MYTLIDVRFLWLAGDIHLAMFRVYKLEGAEVTEESEDSPAKTEADNATQG